MKGGVCSVGLKIISRWMVLIGAEACSDHRFEENFWIDGTDFGPEACSDHRFEGNFWIDGTDFGAEAYSHHRYEEKF